MGQIRDRMAADLAQGALVVGRGDRDRGAPRELGGQRGEPRAVARHEEQRELPLRERAGDEPTREAGRAVEGDQRCGHRFRRSRGGSSVRVATHA